jgi:toxin ParE1/3/4
MAKFYLTNKAVKDLADTWKYTCESWSEKQAEKYYMLLLNSCEELAKSPGKGKKYDEIAVEIMGFRSYQHIIFYRKISTQEIEVVRILHGRMDLKNKL